MMEARITSRKNPLIQRVRRLLTSKKERETAGLFVADGTKLLVEAVRYYTGLRTGGALEEEFNVVLNDVMLNKPFIEALKDMADRVQFEAFTAFVGVVSYGNEIGASITETLKMQGKDLRRARFALAERTAARAPAVMIIPLVLFIMPAVFIVIITPVVLRYKAMGLGAN